MLAEPQTYLPLIEPGGGGDYEMLKTSQQIQKLKLKHQKLQFQLSLQNQQQREREREREREKIENRYTRRQNDQKLLTKNYTKIVSTLPFEIQQLIISKTFTDFRKFKDCIDQFKDILLIYCQSLVWFNVNYFENPITDSTWYLVSSNLFETSEPNYDDYEYTEYPLMFNIETFSGNFGKEKREFSAISILEEYNHYHTMLCLAEAGLIKNMNVKCSDINITEIEKLLCLSREIKLGKLEEGINLNNRKWINKVTEVDSYLYDNPDNLDYFVTMTEGCKSLKKFSLQLWADNDSTTRYNSLYFENIEIIKNRGVQIELSLTSDNLYLNEPVLKTLSKVSNNLILERLESPFSQDLISNLDKVQEINLLNFNDGDSLSFLEFFNQQINCKIDSITISANIWGLTKYQFLNQSIRCFNISLYRLNQCSFKKLENLIELKLSCTQTDMETINSLPNSVTHIDFQFKTNSFEGGPFDYKLFEIPESLEKISLSFENQVNRSLWGKQFTKQEFKEFCQKKIKL